LPGLLQGTSGHLSLQVGGLMQSLGLCMRLLLALDSKQEGSKGVEPASRSTSALPD
jgi:hypothetical protein